MKRILTVILTLSLIALTFTSCAINNYDYDNADKYTKGGGSVSEVVKKIDIEWTSGNVEVKFHGEDSVVFYEDSDKELTDKNSMYHYFDGTTLHIEYCKSGVHFGFTPDKTLTVFIPQSMTLDELEIEAVSSNVNIEGISAKALSIESVSGNISISDVNAAKDVSIEVVSGDLKCHLTEKANSMDVESTSGDVTLYLDSVPRELEIELVSGDALLCLSEDASFTLKHESTSGSFDSEIPSTQNHNEYVFGEGTDSVKVTTVSGDLSIAQK